jgi:cytochrome c oxidase assembly factor CtaG
LLRAAWDFDPLVLLACAAALGYAVYARAAWLAAAALLFFLALASPVGVLSRGYLFSAHMLQHLLLVLGVPSLALLSWRERASDDTPPPRFVHWLGAWLLGVGAMWLWHAPTLCDAASQSLAVQRAQTVSLVLMGGAFWWPIFGPRPSQRLAPFAGMLYLFTACVACTLLGIYITFSPVEVCSVFAHPKDTLGVMPLLREDWGLSPKVDQEIGGLMMWVPACIVYALAILMMLARYYREEDAPEPGIAKEVS